MRLVCILRCCRPNIVHDCLHVDTSANGKIGAGSSGMVFRGRYAGFKVAVKELYSAQMDNNMEESFREAETLARLRHPNIVTFYGLSHGLVRPIATHFLWCVKTVNLTEVVGKHAFCSRFRRDWLLLGAGFKH